MASTNQSPQYQKAESNYLNSISDEDRLYWLQEMIKECPKHKSAEKMLSQLRLRLKKLKESLLKQKKAGKGKQGIKKADLQAVIIGFTNSGKSSILSKLTNAHPKISENKFTTIQPEIGTMIYQGVQIQIIDMPAIESEYFDIGIVHTADTLIITITKIEEIEKIEKLIKSKTNSKQIIAFNKSDLLNENEKRKLSATLQSKKHNFVITSTKTQEEIEQLKEKIFESFNMIRIYLKEPNKPPTDKPLIMKPNAKVKDVAEKIKKGLSSQIKQTIITGPSSKFPNQRVGLDHKLKDKDIVEFKTI